MEFIYQCAGEADNFELYGSDFVSCFDGISATSSDANLRNLARKQGRELARRWRLENRVVDSNADEDDIALLIFGSDAADRLNVRDRGLKQKLLKAATGFTVQDYFGFDPATEPPPTNMPDDCDCGSYNPRAQTICYGCGQPLTMSSPYWIWLNAITRSYVFDRFGVKTGSSYADVIKWLPLMRNYPSCGPGDNGDFYWAIYAVTHIVYTLNDYGSYRLSPAWLPAEYAFLKKNLAHAIEMEDTETMAEFLDSLKAFGVSDKHPLMKRGLSYLLSRQNQDGSWGNPDAEDVHERYHATWTAIDGLRDYAWRGERLSVPKLKPLLETYAADFV